MKPYQRQFIEFALSKQVLKFGEFTLKSGRKSPYFFNAGLFNTGRDLALLGRFYAEALVDSGKTFRRYKQCCTALNCRTERQCVEHGACVRTYVLIRCHQRKVGVKT